MRAMRLFSLTMEPSMHEETNTISYMAMQVIAELAEFFRVIRSWVYLWFLSAFVIFSLGLNWLAWREYRIPIPSFEEVSLAAQILTHMTEFLVPQDVTLVATNPFSAFAAQVLVSALAALVITFPFLFVRVLAYLSPALYASERRGLMLTLGFASILFAGGCAFGYFIVLPTTLHFLYGYVGALGAVPFFSVTEFIALVVSFTFVAGVCFLLPIVMVCATVLGIVPHTFWWRSWRSALLLFLIASAIITPDGSGVSMVLLASPLSILYGVGAGVSSWTHARADVPLSV
jgi:sec-independent protein translocase protein TatC